MKNVLAPCLAVAAVLTLAACTTTTAPPVTDTMTAATTPAAASASLSILDRPFTSTDALPDDANVTVGIVPNSQRLETTIGTAKYWIAKKTGAGVCMIVIDSNPSSPNTFSICGDVPTESGGTVTGMIDGDNGHTWLFTGDGSSRAQTGFTRLAENVYYKK